MSESIVFNNNFTRKVKVVFLGEQSVGKTSIITKFSYDSYETAYNATIGVDFLTKEISTRDRRLTLQLWDTAGQERFRSLVPGYVRNSNLVIIVYDITNMQTFIQIKYWVDFVRDIRGSKPVIVMVGNKTDLNDRRQVGSEEAKLLAEELKLGFIETSARTGFNVSKLFRDAVNSLLPEVIEPITRSETVVQLKDTNDIVVSPAKGCLCLPLS